MSFWEILICVIISIGVTIGLSIERDKAIESKVNEIIGDVINLIKEKHCYDCDCLDVGDCYECEVYNIIEEIEDSFTKEKK